MLDELGDKQAVIWCNFLPEVAFIADWLEENYGPVVRFTGEVGTLAGRGAIATARAVDDTEVIAIDEEALRQLVVAEADLSELIMRAYILRRVALIEDKCGGTILIGSTHSSDTLRLREFLVRNGQPVAYFDLQMHEASSMLLHRFGVGETDIPVLIASNGEVYRNPGNRAAADAIGLSPDRMDGKRYDVVVAGAGPAGLAAAVYAASEGLRVAVLDMKAPGGQAGEEGGRGVLEAQGFAVVCLATLSELLDQEPAGGTSAQVL